MAWRAASFAPDGSAAHIGGQVLKSAGKIRSCRMSFTTIASFLAKVLACPKNNLRQRLREWCYDAKDKAGRKRAELDLEACFAPLLGWIVSCWASQEHQLALALDATTLSSRFTVLAISVQYRGCAIPVAWYVMPAHQKGTWRPQWEALLHAIAPSIPCEWMVIVMADRGLYAPWLYQQIVALGWHPFLRVNEQVLLRLQGSQEPFRAVSEWVRKARRAVEWKGGMRGRRALVLQHADRVGGRL
ncbi:hypothetical protein [Ktedonobacter racemifer]|uniref:hypothetical protein n=1 Tax=Ktedonobacter racemifer TaxID=363277 RepID=UPI0006972AD6|nr:hypothetical protein [Ktedonobacter racemifer]